ncbi:AFR480Cp [Eremothecium gossypii ATCC 10895]|uniref:Mitochondrial 15S rRNA processing factor CCM1 n=1 Tax=Eremothecium gossypii (strain ATCC 10895 / CBS 109.51 / FGSC 9923 / NRRL Y-1056) TaxID=284811 RepID=CCM1_EREGS|nr:AFR480Cp [Eremothecium gossypii ATCC 10895]Q752U3.1 RecName: Full=Mitochondrial group I intron splicing factor CCM1; Flags: Precursor [Eremothecium gossypii ATCC 10895]AAS53851.1 AFR480Cp [Eremothecium gossypii ATCC 10895]
MILKSELLDVHTRLGQMLPFVTKRFASVPTAMRTRRRTRRHEREPNLRKRQGGSHSNLKENEDAELKFKLRQMNEFAKNLKMQMQLADSLRRKEEAARAEGIGGDVAEGAIERDSSTVAAALLEGAEPAEAQPAPLNLSQLIMSAQNAEPLLAPELAERIGDGKLVYSALVNKRAQNWDAIVAALYESAEKLRGLDADIVKEKLLLRVSGLSLEGVATLDKLLTDRFGEGRDFDVDMYGVLFETLGEHTQHTQQAKTVVDRMKKLLQRYDACDDPDKKPLTQEILNCCLKVGTAAKSFDDMNYFLSKFVKDYRILPNKVNYDQVLTFYLKNRTLSQAWETFGAMKFMSLSHRPDVATYNLMLQVCDQERNYSKALDLYHEIQDLKMEPDVRTLSMLAKAMASASTDAIVSEGKSDSLRLTGWKFIHEIENNPKYATAKDDPVCAHGVLTTMMALASYDGDVGLARALFYRHAVQSYKKLMKNANMDAVSNPAAAARAAWTQAIDPVLFNYLLMAYSRYQPNKLPILLGYELGAKFRRQLMFNVDYMGRAESDNDMHANIPLLPVMELSSTAEVLNESRALWEFFLSKHINGSLQPQPSARVVSMLEEYRQNHDTFEGFMKEVKSQVKRWQWHAVNRRLMTPITIMSYLSIPLRLGSYEEFAFRYKQTIYTGNELEESVKNFYDPALVTVSDEATVVVDDSEVKVEKYARKIDDRILQIYSFAYKNRVYNDVFELAMKAATKFRDNSLATRVWKERGEFRKTEGYTSMSVKDRIAGDTSFACATVKFFVAEKRFSEAMAVIMSSQKYIDWKYHMVRELHNALVSIEDSVSIRKLLSVVNKQNRLKVLNTESPSLTP